MADQSSNSSDSGSHEGVLRSAIVSVPAMSRLRSLSGTIFAPAGFGRVRRESGPAAVPEDTAITSGVTPNSNPGASSPNIVNNRYVCTELVLTNSYLYYEAQNWRREVLLEDLLGIQISPKPPTNKPNACDVEVHYYPISFNRAGKKQGRKRLVMNIRFESEASVEENVKFAEDWKKAIILESYKAVRREFVFSDQTSFEELTETPQRKLLVLINPVGGPGKSVSEFEKQARPLFDLAEIKYDVIVTERQNHARDLMKDFDFSTIDGIAISAGDGLLYEAINGIMEREDWEDVIDVPFGMLPTGSGNALCASALYESDEEFSLTNAAFQIIRGGVIPSDIATVQTEDGYKCYMSLLAAWGLVADIDIESERFRKIGGSRFFLGALNCIMRKRIYCGRLSYLPLEEDQPSQATEALPDSSQDQEIESNTDDHGVANDKVNTDLSTVKSSVVPETSSHDQIDAFEVAELGATAEPAIEDYDQQHEDTPITLDTTPPPNNVESASITEATNADREAIIDTKKKIMTKCQNGPKADLLPALNEPVPDNWVTLEGDFLAVSVLMIPHMAKGSFGNPALSIGTQRLNILFVQTSMTRKEMLSLFLESDKGVHMDMDAVTSVFAKAYRLEPETKTGLFTIDGESVPYGHVQSQIHPGLARVMCRKRKN